MLDFQTLHSHITPPPLFERGAPMWHDPYISKQMLTFHLNENHDIASRRPETIDQIVAWITQQTDLQIGMSLLDLGCGPGLYTQRFANKGVQTTGIDYSQNSIDYAKEHDSATTYIYQNYNDMQFEDDSFDVVMMIYGDLCVLSNEERDNLLAKVHKMLKPNGYFIFDVTQPHMHHYLHDYNQWSIAPDGGFWKPDPHLVLEQGFAYKDDITLHQYVVIESDGTKTLYRNWFHDYTAETITPILKSSKFNKINIYSDLIGTPYVATADWCGVIAQKQ